MQVYEYEDTGSNSLDLETGSEIARFSVLYTKVSTRKHKKWEGDGVLICYSNLALLKSEDEKDVISRSTSVKRIDDLHEGKEFKMGVWEVQIQERIQTRDSNVSVSPAIERPQTNSLKRAMTLSPAYNEPRPKLGTAERRCSQDNDAVKDASRRQFRCPLVATATPDEEVSPFIVNKDRVEEYGEEAVVADISMSRHLREHQKDGIRFIFSRLQEGRGVILADEMGLGKSIQTIVATLALMKQPKRSSRYIPKKCLLVVPSSLVNNWKSEFRKWFYRTRIPAITVTKTSDISSYACSYITYPYLIISYEMSLRYIEKLAAVRFDILVCDEGHRLKNINTKLRQALDSLGISRRMLLTGTPLQNDVEEFFSLLDFVRPTQFGNVAEFKSKCSAEDSELNATINDCLLRRTAEVNNVHLPVRNEYVLFCEPSPIQRNVFRALCDHVTGEPLVLINMMRKAANHPAILYKKLSRSAIESGRFDYSRLLSAFPTNYGDRPASLADSGKLSVFVEMMASFRQLGECAVVVSNSTKTLDMLASLCSSLDLSIMRLDGQTPIADRQQIVNKFNSERDPENVFLLSTRAGGVGLNLIGASRLILFDSEWNPALDLQAMARIWRDGQTRPCHIYRLVTAGTIDEKILQRQVKKAGLTSLISLNDQSSKFTFADEDLEDIFTIAETQCETHDLLGCKCDGSGLLPAEIEEEASGEEDEDEMASASADEVSVATNTKAESSEEKTEERDANRKEEDEDLTEEVEDEPATMAELFRWRHYSSRHPQPWEYFKSIAGFDNTTLNELTFAFHLSSKY
ncbi:hypothetical protein RB195_003875 [Necator americanus]|uniref:DNA repair and recombination protein RAD54-like n=1 Tax=Necator americanus TaxID=51031 RepID=A0ABR1DQK3_NECAM